MLAFSNDYYGMIFRATQSVELFCAYIKAAHFLPAYWYNQAVKNIDFHPVRELGFISICMGILLLFAAAIFVVALRITKAPDGFKKHTAAVAAHK